MIMLYIEMCQRVCGEQKNWGRQCPEFSPSQRARMCCSVWLYSKYKGWRN